jgi:hypothetical protein
MKSSSSPTTTTTRGAWARAVVLREGRVVAQGPPEEVLADGSLTDSPRRSAPRGS